MTDSARIAMTTLAAPLVRLKTKIKSNGVGSALKLFGARTVKKLNSAASRVSLGVRNFIRDTRFLTIRRENRMDEIITKNVTSRRAAKLNPDELKKIISGESAAYIDKRVDNLRAVANFLEEYAPQAEAQRREKQDALEGKIKSDYETKVSLIVQMEREALISFMDSDDFKAVTPWQTLHQLIKGTSFLPPEQRMKGLKDYVVEVKQSDPTQDNPTAFEKALDKMQNDWESIEDSIDARYNQIVKGDQASHYMREVQHLVAAKDTISELRKLNANRAHQQDFLGRYGDMFGIDGDIIAANKLNPRRVSDIFRKLDESPNEVVSERALGDGASDALLYPPSDRSLDDDSALLIELTEETLPLHTEAQDYQASDKSPDGDGTALMTFPDDTLLLHTEEQDYQASDRSSEDADGFVSTEEALAPHTKAQNPFDTTWVSDGQKTTPTSQLTSSGNPFLTSGDQKKSSNPFDPPPIPARTSKGRTKG
ncbi:hypothetical protein ACH42_03115 [Endozoicomonas sp. (ex Bugula neritina AB1)]|nr:hypothetical protein ACH42_03115 [Endozoicomonas sp. (ex Bugula neritina AB1)]